MESKTKNVESKIEFGQLILRKIIKTVATRCQILRLNAPKSKIWLGLRPRPRWGAYSTPPGPLAGFKGPASKGRGRECRGGERRGVLWIPKKILKIEPDPRASVRKSDATHHAAVNSEKQH